MPKNSKKKTHACQYQPQIKNANQMIVPIKIYQWSVNHSIMNECCLLFFTSKFRNEKMFEKFIHNVVESVIHCASLSHKKYVTRAFFQNANEWHSSFCYWYFHLNFRHFFSVFFSWEFFIVNAIPWNFLLVATLNFRYIVSSSLENILTLCSRQKPKNNTLYCINCYRIAILYLPILFCD